MKIAGIIPARFASSRFPGKPLVDIDGKTMIRRVYEQVLKAGLIKQVIVATDDGRIKTEVESFGGNVVMTSDKHRSGTDRCAEVMEVFDENFDVIINIQGDEPFIDPNQVNLLAEMFWDKSVEIATLAKKIIRNEDLMNPNVVKVVADINHCALYFSRSPIPYFRGKEPISWINEHDYFKHIGIYGYRSQSLREIVKLTPGILERAESLEQLRWIENGFRVFVKETESESIAVDTPDDLKKLSTYFR